MKLDRILISQAVRWGLVLGLLLGTTGFAQTATNAPVRTADSAAADKAWDALLGVLPSTEPPAEWQKRAPTPEQIAAFEQRTAELAGQSADRARAFYTNFPTHAQAPQARQLEYQLLNLSVQLGNKDRRLALATLEDARLKDPNSTEDERFEVRMRQTMRPFNRLPPGDKADALAGLEKATRALQTEFPSRPEVFDVLLLVAQSYLENNNLEKFRGVAREVAEGGTGDARRNAQALLRRVDRIGQPVKLKFVTTEGDDFDLQKLRGKVVLLDFWATWCAPCRAGLPELKSVYKKYRSKGLEIVGVSLDQDREVFQKFVANQNMTWPQCFDGRGWENKVGREFEITSIPALWLIDRNGNLRELNAREGLAEKVEKLLAEKP